MDAQLIARLQSKSIKNSITNNIAKDFNRTPILAEAYFTQIKEYFLQHADVKLLSGQIHYLAISDNEPAGKPVALCKKLLSSSHCISLMMISLFTKNQDSNVCVSIGSYVSPKKQLNKVHYFRTKILHLF